MRARPPLADPRAIATQIEATPGIERLRALSDDFAAASPDTVAAILEEAARFSDTVLAPLNDASDSVGCAVVDKRVKTPPGHIAAWHDYVAGGWPSLDHPVAIGGQGLPLVLAAGVQELFDRGNPAFGMAIVPQRSAARLIAAHGDDAMRDEWLPKLVSGEWAATICISEAEAGSDVNRLRTRAEPDGRGGWTITGEKTWISFGDHDLAPRIGHCLLARTAGQDGLSLFLVPDTLADGARNAVHVRRIEGKCGLHGSPTCALGFEGAAARLIGVEGRGLQQMFVMIVNMRLSVGMQGLGIASAAADVAWRYAAERKQGGPRDGAVTIDRHADVQRMLLDMAARVDVLRGLIHAAAVAADLGQYETDEAAKAEAAALAQWLLPIIKTTGGEYAFENGSDAVQVLGGAGYTREWPAEQCLRDARVLTVYEGTTGIQALDLLMRRLRRGDASGYAAFVGAARAAARACPDAASGAALDAALDIFTQTSERLKDAAPADAEAGATAYLHLAALLATGWIAARNVAVEGSRFAETGRYWLSDIAACAAAFAAAARIGAARLAAFDRIAGAAQ